MADCTLSLGTYWIYRTFVLQMQAKMKIALAQLDYIIGDFEFNRNKIKQAVRKAHSEGADMVVFSELAICGYPPKDFLDYPDFVSKCHEMVHSLLQDSRDIAIYWKT
jgi:NAD+ synthase (glutamine-hydrolysing)